MKVSVYMLLYMVYAVEVWAALQLYGGNTPFAQPSFDCALTSSSARSHWKHEQRLDSAAEKLILCLRYRACAIVRTGGTLTLTCVCFPWTQKWALRGALARNLPSQ